MSKEDIVSNVLNFVQSSIKFGFIFFNLANIYELNTSIVHLKGEKIIFSCYINENLVVTIYSSNLDKNTSLFDENMIEIISNFKNIFSCFQK
jgi:hypothetical protein